MLVHTIIQWRSGAVPGSGVQVRVRARLRTTSRPALGHPDALGRVFNLGGTEEISMADLAERIIRLAGSTSAIEYIPYDLAYEEGFEDMERRVPDTTRAHELVGFAPTAGLDDIIRAVIDDQQR